MDRICVYTCITGNYDELKEIKVKEKDIDYLCFTNNKNIKSKTWQVIYIEDFDLDNTRLARKIKILGHDIINCNYDISVWVDAAFQIKKNISDFLEYKCDLKNYDFISYKHSKRDCVYDEAIEVVKLIKEDIDKVKELIKFYDDNNYPKNNGLIESGIIVRNLHSKKMIKTMKMWFDFILKYSKRDQLSFNWCQYVTKMKTLYIEDNIFDNDYFVWKKHGTKLEEKRYRVYFDDVDYENYDIDKVVDGVFTKLDDLYIAYIIVKNKSNHITLEILNEVGSKLLDIKISGDHYKDKTICNGFDYDDSIIIDNDKFTIIINGDFRSNDKLNITLKIIDQSIPDCVKLLNDSVNKNDKLLLEKNNYINENNNLKQELSNILNSKSWKITRPLRFVTEKLNNKK